MDWGVGRHHPPRRSTVTTVSPARTAPKPWDGRRGDVPVTKEAALERESHHSTRFGDLDEDGRVRLSSRGRNRRLKRGVPTNRGVASCRYADRLIRDSAP